MSESISLKEYIDRRFNENDKQTEQLRQSMDKRLDGMNEFRDALKDQASRFITQDKVETMFKQVASQNSVNITRLLTIVAIIVSIISVIVTLTKR